MLTTRDIVCSPSATYHSHRQPHTMLATSHIPFSPSVTYHTHRQPHTFPLPHLFPILFTKNKNICYLCHTLAITPVYEEPPYPISHCLLLQRGQPAFLERDPKISCTSQVRFLSDIINRRKSLTDLARIMLAGKVSKK